MAGRLRASALGSWTSAATTTALCLKLMATMRLIRQLPGRITGAAGLARGGGGEGHHDCVPGLRSWRPPARLPVGLVRPAARARRRDDGLPAVRQRKAPPALASGAASSQGECRVVEDHPYRPEDDPEGPLQPCVDRGPGGCRAREVPCGGSGGPDKHADDEVRQE